MTSTHINTKTAEHRKLRFENFDALWAEVERIAAAKQAGTLRTTGNWTAGQNLNHMAVWVGYTLNGFPPELRPPWFVKIIAKMMKNRFLTRGLPKGARIPKIPGGTLGIEDPGFDAAKAKLRSAWDRLLVAQSLHPSPLFGALSREDWINGHLRHSELHMGFLHP
jgi:hypothetical protein